MSVSWTSALHCNPYPHCSPGNVPTSTPATLISAKTGQQIYKTIFTIQHPAAPSSTLDGNNPYQAWSATEPSHVTIMGSYSLYGPTSLGLGDRGWGHTVAYCIHSKHVPAPPPSLLTQCYSTAWPGWDAAIMAISQGMDDQLVSVRPTADPLT